jgi:hypothetical protein
MKMRAVGNYRTIYEDNTDLSKEQITLIITDFLSSVISLRSSTSEFLPTLNLPNLTPTEVYLLDLRTEVGESYKQILIALQGSVPTSIAETWRLLLVKSQQAEGTRAFGANLNWLEKWKFTFPPYAAGTKNTIGVYRDAWDQSYPYPNVGYWDSYANTQIKDFADVIIGDVINSPNRRTNYAKEAQIDIIKIDIDPTMDSGGVTMDSIGVTMDDFDEVTLLFDSTATTKLDSTSVTMDAM